MDTAAVQALATQIKFKPTFTSTEFKMIPKLLMDNENVLYFLEGLITNVHGRQINGRGMAILTDKRVLFYRKSIIGTETKEEFKIGNISSASSRKGLIYGSMNITVSSNNAEIEQCNKKAVDEFVTKLRSLMNSTIPSNSPSNSNVADEIKKLVELKNQGILTDQEFETQKQRLLSR